MALEGTGGALFITVVDISVVFVVLGALAGFMFLLGRVFSMAKPDPATVELGASAGDGDEATQRQSNSDEQGDLDGETMAAITSAVTMTMAGQPFRITSVQAGDVDTARWVLAGRKRTSRGW